MKNKFNAKPCVIDGIPFPSTAEGDCYLMLKLLVQAGEYRDLQCHVLTKFPIAGLTHKTDFKVWDVKRDEPLWIEYKGMEDQRWRDIKKIWRHCGPGRLKVYKGYGLRMQLVEEIIPKDHMEARLP
jgi:hypothetical protein